MKTRGKRQLVCSSKLSQVSSVYFGLHGVDSGLPRGHVGMKSRELMGTGYGRHAAMFSRHQGHCKMHGLFTTLNNRHGYVTAADSQILMSKCDTFSNPGAQPWA